jgi:succinate dehydrogenase assembly factor 2
MSSVSPMCIRTSRPSKRLVYRAISTSAVDGPEPEIDDSLLPQPIDRAYETPEVTRARLLYQSRKRGILETDLLLSTFAHKHLSTMSQSEMHEYDKVLRTLSFGADEVVTG